MISQPLDAYSRKHRQDRGEGSGMVEGGRREEEGWRKLKRDETQDRMLGQTEDGQ